MPVEAFKRQLEKWRLAHDARAFGIGSRDASSLPAARPGSRARPVEMRSPRSRPLHAVRTKRLPPSQLVTVQHPAMPLVFRRATSAESSRLTGTRRPIPLPLRPCVHDARRFTESPGPLRPALISSADGLVVKGPRTRAMRAGRMAAPTPRRPPRRSVTPSGHQENGGELCDRLQSQRQDFRETARIWSAAQAHSR